VRKALKLGDEANAKSRYTLAEGYYGTADADDKAKAVEERARQAAMQKMQPSIDQMRKQAEAIQKEFGDPAKIARCSGRSGAQGDAGTAAGRHEGQTNKKAARTSKKELGL